MTAALTLFSQHGYDRVTVGDICKEAGANQASVNYYFRGKAGLYRECWQHACDRFGEELLSGGEADPPEIQLGHYIRALMKNFMDPGEKGYFNRLYMMELVRPTGLIGNGWLERVRPRRERLHRIIGRIMGRTAETETVVLCELSIASLCRNLLTVNPGDLASFLGRPVDQAMIDRMVAHVTAFALAGIRAVGAGQGNAP